MKIYDDLVVKVPKGQFAATFPEYWDSELGAPIINPAHGRGSLVKVEFQTFVDPDWLPVDDTAEHWQISLQRPWPTLTVSEYFGSALRFVHYRGVDPKFTQFASDFDPALKSRIINRDPTLRTLGAFWGT